MRPSASRIVSWSAVFLFLLVRAAAAVDVSSCGTTVPKGQIGVLVSDLDCSGGPKYCADDASISCSSAVGAFDCLSQCVAYGVHLERNAALQMNGHTISGGDYGVLCRDFNCKVDGGGGTIANQEFSAVWLFGGGKLAVSNLTIHDQKRGALVIAYFAHKMVLRNLTLYNNAGIFTNLDVDAVDVSLAGSPPGGCGFEGSLQGRRIKATNVTAGYVAADRLKAKNLTVNAPCFQGIRVQGSTTLIGSSITGAQKVDVVTGKRPHLVNTTCGTSAQLLPDGTTGGTWGVCTND